jgi:hypothetical protein
MLSCTYIHITAGPRRAYLLAGIYLEEEDAHLHTKAYKSHQISFEPAWVDLLKIPSLYIFGLYKLDFRNRTGTIEALNRASTIEASDTK